MSTSEKLHDSIEAFKNGIASMLLRPHLTKIKIITALFYLGVVFLFYTSVLHKRSTVLIGEAAPETIVSTVEFSWVDEEMAEQIIRDREAAAPSVFVLDMAVHEQQLIQFQKDVAQVFSVLQEKNDSARMQTITSLWGPPDTAAVYYLDEALLTAVEPICKNIMQVMYEKGVASNDLKLNVFTGNVEIRRKSDNILINKSTIINIKERDQFVSSYLSKSIEADYRYIELTRYIVKKYIQENVSYSDELTIKNKEMIKKNYLPERLFIRKGELLCSKGQVVDKKTFLKVQGMYTELRKMFTIRVVGFALFLAFFFIIVRHYLRVYHEAQYTMARSMLLFTGFMFILILGFFSRIFPAGYLYMFPYLGFLLLLFFVFKAEFTLFSSLVFSVGLMIFHADPRFALMHVVSTVFFLVYASRLRSRIPSLRMTAMTFIITFLAAVTLDTAFSGIVSSLSMMAFRTAVSVLGSFILGYLLLYIYEKAADITSDIRLNELLDMHHPLLKELMNHAPGTYRHSIIVSELAEEACKQIHADALLAKVGGLYHDVGKVRRPEYFIENQLLGPNKHDALPPLMSVRILKNHVADAEVKLRQYGFGKRIRDIVREHHGKSLIQYFYTKALKNTRKEDVIEHYFRYDSPLPSTKEAAVVFLADKTEAVSRVMSSSSIITLAERIHRLIQDALEDGQLDNAPITIAELTIIEASFVQYFRGMMHKRIEYPELLKE